MLKLSFPTPKSMARALAWLPHAAGTPSMNRQPALKEHQLGETVASASDTAGRRLSHKAKA